LAIAPRKENKNKNKKVSTRKLLVALLFLFLLPREKLRKGISRRQTQLISFVKSFSDTIVVFSPERTRVEREGGIPDPRLPQKVDPPFLGVLACVFVCLFE
jgi:hypothetical protein